METDPGSMLRLLSWNPGLAADKIVHQEVNYMAPQLHRPRNIEFQNLPMLKRKRDDVIEIDQRCGSSTKIQTESIPRQLSEITSAPRELSYSTQSPVANEIAAHTMPERSTLEQGTMENAHSQPDVPAIMRTKHDEKLRQTLNAQISLEILLKHDELRLIDQEMAKCQIALEQLRRCTEIPYPINKPSQKVSQGQGAAIRSSRSSLRPESPAPWGVTDGPYTRHYAKWLLPDPLFDGGEPPRSTDPKRPAAKTANKGRSTRGTVADSGLTAGLSNTQRAGKFQALSSGYPQPKDKAGPMIQKRKSDGVLVKLVCLDCRRDNFSSAQGFINHCRIAHVRSFASHDAAADACGEPVDLDGAGAVVGIDGPASASMAGLVHPLIYSAHVLTQRSLSKAPGSLSNPEQSGILPVMPVTERQTAETSRHLPTPHLTPSVLTPNLSTLMQRQGTKLDLRSLVAEMKTSVSAPDSSESERDEDEDEDRDITMKEAPSLGKHLHLTASMQPARSTTAQDLDGHSGSGKGLNNAHRRQTTPNQSLLLTTQVRTRSVLTSRYAPVPHADASEHSPTNDSNQAPSLVDDDGDDEYEAPSPLYSVPSSVDTEGREVDFEVEDGDRADSGSSTRNRSTNSEHSATPKQSAAPGTTRRASAFRRRISEREVKHVSFVSPSPAHENEPGTEARESKRKRSDSDL